MRRVLTTLVAAVVAALAALLLGAGPASAHAHLTGSNPADGAVLTAPPTELTLTFSEPLQGAAGIRVDAAPEQTVPTAGAVLTVPLAPLPAGEHTVAYRITSADGHTVTGELRFRITESPATSAPAAPVAGGDAALTGGGTPVWPFVLGGVVILAALVGFAVRRGRR